MSIERTELNEEQIEEISGGKIYTKGDMAKQGGLTEVTSTDIPGKVWYCDRNNNFEGAISGLTGIAIDYYARHDRAGVPDSVVIEELLAKGWIRNNP